MYYFSTSTCCVRIYYCSRRSPSYRNWMRFRELSRDVLKVGTRLARFCIYLRFGSTELHICDANDSYISPSFLIFQNSGLSNRSTYVVISLLSVSWRKWRLRGAKILSSERLIPRRTRRYASDSKSTRRRKSLSMPNFALFHYSSTQSCRSCRSTVTESAQLRQNA